MALLTFPLAGAVLIGLTFKLLPRACTAGWARSRSSRVPERGRDVPGARSRGEEDRQVASVAWDYVNTLGVDAQFSILIDPLSTLMCLMVAGVSTLIHLYSVAYMGGDRGYSRFFAYLNFFVFSMLLLVLAGNFFLLIVGWAFVGAAWYMLISFWYRRNHRDGRPASRRSSSTWWATSASCSARTSSSRAPGTLDFLKTFEAIDGTFTVNDPNLVAGCILLLVGALAKSAQVPLHTWLPDAMAGPSPVSRLSTPRRWSPLACT